MANADATWCAGRVRAVVGMLAVGVVAGCGAASAPVGHRPAASRHPSVTTAAWRPASSRPARPIVLGRSEGGRRIVAIHAGAGGGTRVLVVGAIHGNELAGIAIAHALERLRPAADLWIVPDLNPDGAARGTRQNGRGVDLNRNWSSEWPGGGRPWDVYYPGPRPFSERETRIARRLILRVRPAVTIWYHQHMDLVWAWGPSTAAGRRYARAAGMRLYHRHWLQGTAANWQNHRLPGTAAITVELPAGTLPPRQLRRHVRAVLALARGG